jgi:hypothetical protein
VEQTTTPPEMNEDQVLAYTQSKRRKIVDKLTDAGKVPDDKTEVSLLISALDGMDRAALTQKRIKSDEKTAQGVTGAAAVIAKLLMQVGSNSNPNQISDNVAPPVIGKEVPDPELVPGEAELKPGQLDFDTFTATYQNGSNPSSGLTSNNDS